jgi:hypothetical protein
VPSQKVWKSARLRRLMRKLLQNSLKRLPKARSVLLAELAVRMLLQRKLLLKRLPFLKLL